MKRFGEKLRVLRQRHGMTQIQLGDSLEVKQSYIGKMERGERVPNVAMLIKVSRIFNISADVLMKDELELDD